MPVAPTSPEIAHVLFLDLAGYSRRPMDAEARLIAGLQQRLRGLDDVRRAEAAGNLPCLPTGDGVALVFFGDPQAPARCALDLARALFRDHLRRLLFALSSDPVLAEAVREQLRGRSLMAAEPFYRLRSAGVLAGDIPREAHFRCPLYAAYLELHPL